MIIIRQMIGFLVFAYYRAALFGTAATMVSFTFGQVGIIKDITYYMTYFIRIFAYYITYDIALFTNTGSSMGGYRQ